MKISHPTTYFKISNPFLIWTIKQFACEKDFHMQEIPHMKHISNHPISREMFQNRVSNFFRALQGWVIEKCFIPGLRAFCEKLDCFIPWIRSLIFEIFERFNGSKYILYGIIYTRAFLAQRNLSHKQNVLFYGPLRTSDDQQT